MVSICVKIVRLKKGKLVFDRFIYIQRELRKII